jgi:hypothetical protein
MKTSSIGLAGAALLAVAVMPGVARAAPCVSGSLASYISQGSCTDGTLVFSAFTYDPDGSNGGQTPAAANVTVVPVTGGLQFDSLWNAPTPGAVSDASLAYKIMTNDGSSITDASLQEAGVANGSGAFATVTEALSTGGQLMTSDKNLGPIDATFAGVSTLMVTKDIDATAGTGSADVSSFNEGFSTTSMTVPAPPIGTTLPGLLAVVIALVGWKLGGLKLRS